MTEIYSRDIDYASGTTGGSSTAYTLSISTFGTAYRDLDSRILIKFHVTNGASPTLNVNSIGAKALVDQNNTAIPVGLLDTDGVYEFVYNQTNDNFVYLNATTSQISGGNGGNAVQTITATAIENLTAEDAVYKNRYIDLYTVTTDLISSVSGGSPVTSIVGQALNIPINSNVIKTSFYPKITASLGLVPLDFVCRIYAATGTIGVNGNKTGPVLYSQSISTTMNASYEQVVEFTFVGASLSAGDYFFEFETTANAFPTVEIRGSNAGTHPGNFVDNGTPNAAKDMYFAITTDVDLLRKTNASDISSSSFIGFAKSTVSAGNTVDVDVGGIVTKTGVVNGSNYYLANVAGTISTSPGANNVYIGKGTGTGLLRISRSNDQDRFSLASGTTYAAGSNGMITVYGLTTNQFTASISIGSLPSSLTAIVKTSVDADNGDAITAFVRKGEFYKVDFSGIAVSEQAIYFTPLT